MDLCQQSDSLLFNLLSGFVIAFLPRSKHLLISWLVSNSQVLSNEKVTPERVCALKELKKRNVFGGVGLALTPIVLTSFVEILGGSRRVTSRPWKSRISWKIRVQVEACCETFTMINVTGLRTRLIARTIWRAGGMILLGEVLDRWDFA